jgi:Tfp pilus assembly protein PilF
MVCRQKKNTKILIAALVFLCFCQTDNPAQKKSSPVDTEKIEKLLAESALALQIGNLNRAKTILQKVLTIAPRNVAANTLAGAVADKENNLAEAEKYFAAAARLAPNSPDTHNNYGAILARQNRPVEAAREFSASLKLNPNQPSSLTNLAQLRLAENDLAAARELFAKAKTIAPDGEILRVLVSISLRLNDKEAARRNFQEYSEFIKKNDLSPTDPTFGEELLTGGLYAEAQQELELILKNSSENKTALVLLARAFLGQKNIRAAGKLLESAIANGAADSRIYAALAEVYQAGGFLENAIPALRLAVEKEPANDFYQARYGLLLIDSKAPAAAVIRMTEAAGKFPRSAKINFVLGVALFIDGKSVEAEAAFERALKIEPNFVPSLAYLATLYAERGQFAEAATFFERALKTEESTAVLHYLLADTLLKIQTSDVARIQKHLERAIELDKSIAGAHLALGQLLARSGNWTNAIAEFEQAIVFAPESAEAHYQLGRALARAKRTEESKTVLEKFKRLSETQATKRETERKDLVRRLADVRF